MSGVSRYYDVMSFRCGFIISRSFASYISRKRDYYEVLGISYDADPQQINSAFIRKSKEFHPDGKDYGMQKERTAKDKYAPNMTEQFMELKLAYDVLRHPVRKKQYDRLKNIERKKRFTKSENSALYANKISHTWDSEFPNFSMTLDNFIRFDPYVLLAGRSDNLLLYLTLGAIAIVLIVEYFYVRTLKPDDHKKDTEKVDSKR